MAAEEAQAHEQLQHRPQTASLYEGPAFQQGLVPLRLHGAEGQPDISEHLRGQSENLLFLATEHERAEERLQLFDGLPLATARGIRRLGSEAAVHGLQRAIQAVRARIQHVGPQKPQQREQLAEVILQRRPRQQHPAATWHSVEGFAQPRPLILDLVRLVEHDNPPPMSQEEVFGRNHCLVRGDNYVLEAEPDLVVFKEVLSLLRHAA
mmetsp:Transcript_20224/g.58616  ORF Transcript_20224/g.58616 Transcript_20224/m.58616 type:complete len:208 (-) Transcript_20224:420-1043(-)